MKRKVMLFVIIIGVLVGSAQVFAATVLNTNLIDLIKTSFEAIKSHYTAEVDNNTNDLTQKYNNEAATAIQDIKQNAYNDLENFKNNEIARSEQELNAYFEQMKQELNQQANGYVGEIKGSITDNVNKSIEKTKEEINKAIEKQIKDNLKIN
jgi:DNA anti-recombination protein RmuC